VQSRFATAESFSPDPELTSGATYLVTGWRILGFNAGTVIIPAIEPTPNPATLQTRCIRPSTLAIDAQHGPVLNQDGYMNAVLSL
jgi:hypothetical protein